MDDGADLLEKLGAMDIFKSLLKKKRFYKALTTKKAFEVITRHLVSDDPETKKFMYILMCDLVDYFEQHERLEKRINIDNFEDEELLNSHSGSFRDVNKSKNNSSLTKKQNQEVLMDIKESDLFHFFKVVIQEITSGDIEDRHELIKAPHDTPIRMGSYLLSLVDFLEKASSAFSGFQYDINQMIIEKDLFLYLFDIVEYYKYSDFLIKKVFKIIKNIITTKNEDIQEMLRYLFEETDLIPFLIRNGPVVIISDPVPPVIPKAELPTEDGSERDEEKAPEQSVPPREEPQVPQVVQLSNVDATAIRVHVKDLAVLIQDYLKKDKTQEGLQKYQAENSQQSGEASSEIILEGEEEIQVQKVCKVLVRNFADNEQWKTLVKGSIEPLIELEKGKLCQEEENSKSDLGSLGNIFDDDFIRSDFAVTGSDVTSKEESKGNQKEEEEDHQKFVKKMQECFSSQKSKGKRKSIDYIDDEERERKTNQFQSMGINDEMGLNLRESLSDMNDQPVFRRDRSASNEKFDLPPLSNFDDNKDLMEDSEGLNIMGNYNSNDYVMKSSIFSSLADVDQKEFSKEVDKDLLRLKELGGNSIGAHHLELDIGEVAIDLEGDNDQGEQVTGFEVYDEDLERSNEGDNILGKAAFQNISPVLSEPIPQTE